ncbi:MAG: biliverdin-producing heme oxygenase [Phycisphaerales bacterium]|nr:biliverdin-producing heme oxygenase [Phycisphaerales bacterium]
MTSTPSATEIGLHERLRVATQALHTMAEKHPVQARLVRGEVDRSSYAEYLRLMLGVHRAVESALETHLHDPVLAPVERAQFRAGLLEQDLDALEATSPGKPTPVQRMFSLAVRGAGPLELLGMQYVLEGSTNGGRFIARAVSAPLGLRPGDGTAYLNPYGADQQARWKEFCGALGAVDCTWDEGERVVDGALVMFGSLIQLFNEAEAAPRHAN